MGKKTSVAENNRDDKTYIKAFASWWTWPFCPVKRGNNSLKDKNLGFLLATEEHSKGKMVIYHLYMFLAPFSKEQLEAADKTQYDSIDAMLADGWVVD